MEIPRILRLIFLKETFILIGGLVFLWFSISLYVDSNYTIKNLTPHNGVIERLNITVVKVINKPLFNEVTKQLRVQLASNRSIYILETTDNFTETTSKIGVGDTVTIFTKPKLWGIFGLKKASVISHLTKDNEVIIDYAAYKNSISGLIYLTLSFSLIFIIVYFTRLRHRLWWDFGGYKSAERIA